MFAWQKQSFLINICGMRIKAAEANMFGFGYNFIPRMTLSLVLRSPLSSSDNPHPLIFSSTVKIVRYKTASKRKICKPRSAYQKLLLTCSIIE